MSETDAIGILKAARAKIAKPEDWGKKWRAQRSFHTHCAAEAIEEVSYRDYSERRRAYRALQNAAGGDNGIVSWNDAPERTHSEVIAAFNLAIATLELGA